MTAFRKRPVVVDATQWWRNGDHPLDYASDASGHRRAHGHEGEVVRYFRSGDEDDAPCAKCGQNHFVHGWIDTLDGGHIVCPGDWIITGVNGEHYPCKPDIFAKTYEPVGPAEGDQ